MQRFGSRICNFRASTFEDYEEWLKFKRNCKTQGLDICHVNIGLIRAWNKAVEGNLDPETITSSPNVVNVQMQNTFVYQPQRPRREPNPPIISSKNLFSGTITGLALEAYVTEKTRELNRSVSFRDFMELDANLFRKTILRLRRKGKLLPLEPRSRPRFYILPEWCDKYPSMQRNITVKHLFSPFVGGESLELFLEVAEFLRGVFPSSKEDFRRLGLELSKHFLG